jgi:hypothetical protein
VVTGRGGVDALVMNPDNAGMVQPRGGAGFPLKALQEDWVGGEPGGHHLDCNRTLQPGVRAPVDGGHATAGQHGTNPVAPIEQGADQVPVMLGPPSFHSSGILELRPDLRAWPGSYGPGAARTAEGHRLAGMAW